MDRRQNSLWDDIRRTEREIRDNIEKLNARKELFREYCDCEFCCFPMTVIVDGTNKEEPLPPPNYCPYCQRKLSEKEGHTTIKNG